MTDVHRQAVSGITAPQTAEASIRTVWPSVAAWPAAASAGRVLIRSIVLAPLGWLILAPLYFLKILPFVAKRYTLTNRRLMVQRGLKPTAAAEIPLGDIEDVRVKNDANSEFFRAATLEVLSKTGQSLHMPGVPEPESFRRCIMDARDAWFPGKVDRAFVPAKATSPS